MVEGAAADMKVVERKWAGRMELPMTEVRRCCVSPIPDDNLRCVFFSNPFLFFLCLCFCSLLTHTRTFAPPQQVGTAALFTAEVYAWFCVGEIVGRGGSITGYY